VRNAPGADIDGVIGYVFVRSSGGGAASQGALWPKCAPATAVERHRGRGTRALDGTRRARAHALVFGRALLLRPLTRHIVGRGGLRPAQPPGAPSSRPCARVERLRARARPCPSSCGMEVTEEAVGRPRHPRRASERGGVRGRDGVECVAVVPSTKNVRAV
jgi:hypothetical protein